MPAVDHRRRPSAPERRSRSVPSPARGSGSVEPGPPACFWAARFLGRGGSRFGFLGGSRVDRRVRGGPRSWPSLPGRSGNGPRRGVPRGPETGRGRARLKGGGFSRAMGTSGPVVAAAADREGARPRRGRARRSARGDEDHRRGRELDDRDVSCQPMTPRIDELARSSCLASSAPVRA